MTRQTEQQRPVNGHSQTERAQRAQRLGILIVAGLLTVSLIAITLWLLEKDDSALFFFTFGVAVLIVLSVYTGRLTAEEQRQLEERLAARDFRYRQTLELLPEGVVILRGENRIEWVNSTAKAHFGVTADNAGEDFLEHVEYQEFRRWLRHRDFSQHFTMPSNDGRLILDVAVVAPDMKHMLIVTHDVTARSRLEEMRRDFVANVSHELRTPLTVISGFLEMTDTEMPESVRRYHLQLMREQTERMKHLTDDLLMLSHLENKDDHAPEEAELIAMPRLIDDVVKEGKALSNGQHIFEVRHEDIALVGFPDEIRSAVMNLVSNAVRYTPRGGRISVVWRRSGTGADLTVTDTGIGIAEENIPRVTERFFRVDKGRSRSMGGTGLGLAIVKHVLRRNGGELRIRSKLGEGSAFTFHFPEERVFVQTPL